MKDHYKTVASPAAGQYKEKGSRFIARAYPVSTEEEIKEILAASKAEYFDARHHCHAWILGAGASHTRVNDDGEPPSTAGRPILGQITSRDLTNVLVIVTRYFGGTLLGIPGLTRAYRAAAADALDHAVIVEKTINETLRVTFNYPVLNAVMKLLKEDPAPEIIERHIEETCHVTLRARLRDMPRLRARLLGIESVQDTTPR